MDAMGEMYVDLARYGWFPERLPSEEGLTEEEEDSEDGESGEDGEGGRKWKRKWMRGLFLLY